MDNLILYRSPFTKTRIGSQNDGGYVIVNLAGEYDLLISGGIGGNIQFEEDFLNLYPGLMCYAFDGTIKSLPKNNIKNIRFIKRNLGNINDNLTTNLCSAFNTIWKKSNNIFMKIDIEGHEFRLLPVLIKNNYMNKIKQLVIEIHSPADIQLYPNYFKGLSDIKNGHMFNLLKNINSTHTLVHFHANNGCKMTAIDGIKIPHVFELTYIRNEFIINKVKNTDILPTNLDRPNIPKNKDYMFSGYPYVSKV